MATAPLVELRGVARSYRSPSGGGETVVLEAIDLTVAPGERIAVVGPSGSGKSTLLALLGGLESPSRGTVLWEGRDIAAMDDGERAELRSRGIGFLFQAHHLLPQLSALENALVPTLARAARGRRDIGEARARELFGVVGLAARLDHRPGELSGGERARVALVRALVNAPRLLLADEPTGALDARTAAELGDLLLALNAREGVAFVVVTHAEVLAARLGRVLALREGKLAPQ